MKTTDVLDLIQQESSGKKKEEILKTNDSPELREYFSIALDKTRVFRVSKFPTTKKTIKNKNKDLLEFSREVKGKGFTKFSNLINLLENNEISGYLASNTIVDVFNTFSAKEQEWYRKALCKEAIGVGAEIVNKAFPGLISDFKIMLAPNEQPNLDNICYPKIIQPKIDGFRAVFIPGKGFIGRNGKSIRNINLKTHFSAAYLQNAYVFDGELYCHGIGFNNVASILNSDSKPIPTDLKFYVFDGMTVDKWNKRKNNDKYGDRLTIFHKLDRAAPLKNFIILGSDSAANKQEVMNKYSLYVKGGYEGIMLKDPNGIYTWSRVSLKSEILLKLKPSFTTDCKTIGFIEGEGKYTGLLGKIIVDFRGTKVGIGSGFSDKDREEIWKNQKKYLNMYAEISGMEVTKDASIRHPVWKRWREDK